MPESEPIENHAFVGDLSTVALISLKGCVDFMCFPNFDSPTIFASLLDPENGGHFQIAPELDGATNKQLYLPDSNILLTRFLEEQGVAEISDFMPVPASGPTHNLVRRVKTIRGRIRYRMVCAPRFDYGRALHTCELQSTGVVFTSTGSDRTVLRLRSSVPLEIENGAAVATFTLGPEESAAFVLEDAKAQLPCNTDEYIAQSFKDTLNFWRQWISRCSYQGRWREMVHRSALTLKMLVSQAHGSLVASPTFGLPEIIGSSHNWDYRFTWIRDASFTIYALMRLGYTEEAGAFNAWIEQRCHDLAPDGRMQIMYGLDGRKELPEEVLASLRGYRGSAPVRIGNAAADQLQLDIYGELMDSVYLYDKWGQPISHQLWTDLSRMLEYVCDHWSLADEGIWEIRGGRHEFLFSRVMCWVALDRGVRLARKRSFPAPLAKWIQVRDAIYADIFKNFWDPKRRSFVQRKGATALDASTLLMPLVKFISPVDPQWISTMSAIEQDLVQDSLVVRYLRHESTWEGSHEVEGTFSMCTFWYAECLARGPDPQQGRYIFEKMLGYANHVGLYAEELGPRGEHLGNFPQAFTHLGLISAAYALDRVLSGTQKPR